MKLYYTKRSPYARKVRVLAFEKGIDLELIEVDLSNKPDELLRLNPLGKIPVLEIANGESFSDSTVICEYLDSLSPELPFLPRANFKRMHVLNLDTIAKNLMDTTVAVFYEKFIHPQDFHEPLIVSKDRSIMHTLNFFNSHINDVLEMSMVSITLACAIGYIEFRVGHLWPPVSCPQLADWYTAFSQRDSMQQTQPVM